MEQQKGSPEGAPDVGGLFTRLDDVLSAKTELEEAHLALIDHVARRSGLLAAQKAGDAQAKAELRDHAELAEIINDKIGVLRNEFKEKREDYAAGLSARHLHATQLVEQSNLAIAHKQYWLNFAVFVLVGVTTIGTVAQAWSAIGQLHAAEEQVRLARESLRLQQAAPREEGK